MRWADRADRRRLAGSCALAGLVLIATAAHPNTGLTAAELRDACTRSDDVWVFFCDGYAQATADFAEMSDLACIPDDTSRATLVTQIDALAFDSIAAGEIPGDTPAFAVTMSVLQTLYPCGTDGEASQ